MSSETPERPDLERLRIEGDLRIRNRQLKLEREKWEAERGKQSRGIPPGTTALIAGALGLVGTAFGAWVQGRSNQELEHQKFEFSLIAKAFESGDRIEAARYLAFLSEAGLIQDKQMAARVAAYADAPEDLPLLGGGAPRGVAQLSYRIPDGQRAITKLIISDTQTPDWASTLLSLQHARTTGSYHYLIDSLGVAIPLIPEPLIANHTARHNETSLSIGLVHLTPEAARRYDRPYRDYSDRQIRELRRLTLDIVRRHGLPPDSVLGKPQVDPRKVLSLDVAELRSWLRAQPATDPEVDR